MSLQPSMFINRELSWLEFNRRVLEEAKDSRNPLLERLKFLAITSSNFDEFFMVRVGGLQMLRDENNTKRDPAGLTAAEQLGAISRSVHDIVAEQYVCYADELEPGLARAGIRRLRPKQLNDCQYRVVEKIFSEEICAILTPMAVSLEDGFPLTANLRMNVCVRLESASRDSESRVAIVPFARESPRFIPLPSDSGYQYILLEDVVCMFVNRFFPGEKVLECAPFRVTRNADLAVREDLAADLLQEMQQVLDARKQSACVRLEVSARASSALHTFLQRGLCVDDMDIYKVPGPLDLADFMRLASLEGFEELKYENWTPQPSPLVDEQSSIFEVIRDRDILLYQPFDSFDPVLRLVDEAADDPEVLAIKQILYRTSRHSPIVAALKRAAEAGKNVTAVVELKARFDEARNIGWAKELEQAGVQVIYGVKGLKTHAKTCIIVRREPDGIRRYVHYGTGNYNEVTARLYTDASFMTANDELARDAVNFFNTISGFSQPQTFTKISMAPIGLRERLLELIDGESRRSRRGQRAHIMAQINSLADPTMIEALYAASQAGVRIDLNVRGICCLRPGVRGLSENITVVSILDRFLEHSRIVYFYHGGNPQVFISSADWMLRNLDRRVELLVPVEDATSRNRLIAILASYARDNMKGRQLTSSGRYVRRRPHADHAPDRSQEWLYRQSCHSTKPLDRAIANALHHPAPIASCPS